MVKVTYYTFYGGTGEGLKVGFITRSIIYLCSSKTGYKFVDVSDKFYDTEEEKIKCMDMTEKDFDETIKRTFERQGYHFKIKEVQE